MSKEENQGGGKGIQRDEDWYRISADSDTVELRANVSFTHSEGDIDLALYNEDGDLIRRSVSTSDNESVSFPNPAAGDYFLKVYFGDAGNEYDLAWTALSQAELDDIATGDDPYEENDQIDNAFALTPEFPRLSSHLGLGIQKDEDWYEIEIPQNNIGLRIECLFEDALGDIDFELYDPFGFPVAVRDSLTDNEILDIDTPLPGGTYQIRVFGPNLGNTYDLYFNVFADDAYEENDVIGDATDISLLLGESLPEGPLVQGDDDWYRFEVTGTLAFLEVSLEYKDINGAVDFEVLDSDENVIATATSTADSETVFLPVQAGTHYVRVFGDDFFNEYDLVVTQFGDDAYEENDVPEDAKTIPSDTAIELAQFDDDWFQFEITAANSVFTTTASFTHADGNVDLEVFEASDLTTPIAASMTTGNTESVQVSGAPGTYLVKISGDNLNPDYVLSWSTAPDDDFEENDTFDTATDIRPDKDTEILDRVQFDEDWYQVETQTGEMRLIVDLKYSKDLGNINLTLVDSSENELLVVDTNEDDETLIYPLNPFAGTESYYLKVSGDDSGNTYSLEWTTSIEDNFEGDTGNNLYNEPSKALLESEGIAISKTIGYGALLDEDWYEVRINPGDSELVIEAFFDHSAGDIDLELFNSEEMFLTRSIGVSDLERIHYKGAPGTYYLRVFSELNQNAYDLFWNSFSKDDLELGASYNSGRPVGSNDSPASARNLERADVNTPRGGLDLENALLDGLTLHDEDWYEVAVYTEEDQLLVDLDFDHDRGDIDVALYRHDQVYPDPFRPPLLARPRLPHPVLPIGSKNLVLVEESVSLDDGESILITDPEVGIYYIVVYGYGLSNPKVSPPWGGPTDSDYSYDHVTKDYVSMRGRLDTALTPPDAPDPNPTYNESNYDLSEPGSGLGNTYSMRWSSVGDDTYDKDTPPEVNDSFDHPAEPILLPTVPGNIMVNQSSVSSITNCAGDLVEIFERPIYRFGFEPDLPLVLLDEDWYSFTVGGDPHHFRAQIDFDDYQGNLDLRLYRLDESDGSIELVDESTNVGRGIEFVVAEGTGQSETTYLVQVEGIDKIDGKDLGNEYSLEVRPFADDDFEQNDSIEEANENANISDLCGLDLTAVLQDEDFYRIDVPKNQVHLEVEFASATETIEDSNVNFNIEILDEDGEPLPAGYDISGRSGGIETYRFGVISPEAKTYYLKISEGQGLDPADYSGVSYTFSWATYNVDQYDLRPGGLTGLYGPDNDSPGEATDLTRLRLEPIYDPKGTVLDPVDEFKFDYDLLGDPVIWESNIGVFDGFGHAIQEADGDDWYVLKIPSWELVDIPDPINEEALKRIYYTRLFVEMTFEHDDGDIDMEIYDDTIDLSYFEPGSPNFQTGSPPDPLAASSKSRAGNGTIDTESFFARIGPEEEGREYFIRVFSNYSAEEEADPSIRRENHYNLKWEVFAEDAYERLTDGDETNNTNNFVDQAFDLTEANGVSTEQTWLHEIQFPQDINGDGIIDAADDGSTAPLGYGMQRTDDWYAVVVSPGATELEVITRSYSDNDTGFDPTYTPDDLDIDFEVYFLAGDDGDPDTFEQRRPILVGRSTEPTDLSVFESAGYNSEELPGDITREIEESGTFDVSDTGPGIYFIRIYHDNRSHPYTFYWDDIGDADNSGDQAIIDNYLSENWTFDLPESLPSVPLTSPNANTDGDAFPDWAEYALGLDPSVTDYAVIGQSIGEVEVDGETDRYYQIEFVRNKEAEPLGYEFIVQESDDLNFGSAEAVHVRNDPVPGSLELERAVYRGSKPISEQERCFFRIKVNEPPAQK
ncbi:MAG: PPC domain-containing protein [Opitutales bacterium]